jgi:hypothetical protein
MDKENEEEKGARYGAKNCKSFVPFMAYFGSLFSAKNSIR